MAICTSMVPLMIDDSMAESTCSVRFHSVKAKAVLTSASQAMKNQLRRLSVRQTLDQDAATSSNADPIPMLTTVTSSGDRLRERLM